MHINSCPVKCSRNVASALCETKDDSLGELPLRNVWSACSRVDKATSGDLNVESEKEIDLEATQLILR